MVDTGDHSDPLSREFEEPAPGDNRKRVKSIIVTPIMFGGEPAPARYGVLAADAYERFGFTGPQQVMLRLFAQRAALIHWASAPPEPGAVAER